MYPPQVVQPMKSELTSSGFQDMTTPEQVDAALRSQEGTTLMVINSVCGCAAGAARPGVLMSLQDATKKPDKLTTVFAGFDKEATEKARQYLLPYPPSSPAIALFKNGKLVHFIERHHIEGRPAALIAQNLIQAYNEHC